MENTILVQNAGDVALIEKTFRSFWRAVGLHWLAFLILVAAVIFTMSKESDSATVVTLIVMTIYYPAIFFAAFKYAGLVRVARAGTPWVHGLMYFFFSLVIFLMFVPLLTGWQLTRKCRWAIHNFGYTSKNTGSTQ